MITATVALVRAEPDTILADYARLLTLAGWPADLRVAELRALQPPRQPLPGTLCPPWQLHGLELGLPGLELRASAPPEAGLALLAAVARGRGAALAGALDLLAPRPGGSAVAELRALRAAGRPLLALLDGTMIGNGPPGLPSAPEVGNLLIASLDPLAADALAATLLGLEPLSIPQLREAHAAGLGAATADQITLIGDRELAELRWPPHRARPGERLLAARSARATYTSWIYDTGWGRLFAAYQRSEERPHG